MSVASSAATVRVVRGACPHVFNQRLTGVGRAPAFYDCLVVRPAA